MVECNDVDEEEEEKERMQREKYREFRTGLK